MNVPDPARPLLFSVPGKGFTTQIFMNACGSCLLWPKPDPFGECASCTMPACMPLSNPCLYCQMHCCCCCATQLWA